VNTQTAQEGVVLLKNSGGILPFKRGSKVAVVGPHAVSQEALLEDYFGDEARAVACVAYALWSVTSTMYLYAAPPEAPLGSLCPLWVQVCFNPYDDGNLGVFSNKTFDCIQTLGAAINASNTAGSTMVAKGVDINSTDASGIPAALAAVEWADVVVLAIGLDTITIEHEGFDRPSFDLPGLQVGGWVGEVMEAGCVYVSVCFCLGMCVCARMWVCVWR
jgi:beta-glucosidase